MNCSQEKVDRLLDLAGAVCNKTATESDLVELNSLLDSDRTLRNLYADYCCIHAALRLELRARRATRKVQDQISTEPVITNPSNFNTIGAETSPVAQGALLSTVLRGTVGFFSQEVPFACLIATVIMSLALGICSQIYVTHHQQFARTFGTPDVATPLPSPLSPLPTVVARITGMMDVKWGLGVRGQGSGAENPESRVPSPESRLPTPDSRVPTPYTLVLGDRLEIASGLVQLTYNSGAQVILQGPCTYEVNSPAGGFLALGKLTARVEGSGVGDRGAGRVDSGQWTVDSTKPQASDIHHSSFSTHHSPHPSPRAPNPSPLFTVTTPTAVVADLGTEFGVEVDKSGFATAYVFSGSVKMQATSATGQLAGDALVLQKNESARVEGANGSCQIALLSAFSPAGFVQQIPKQTVKSLDLADVVAGGDGLSGHRDRGIDPRNGRLADSMSVRYFVGDGQYHRVGELPLVDGVFIPRPRNVTDAVQLDSAGHTCIGLPTAETQTLGYVWAGKSEGNSSVLGDGVDYSSPGHGMIALHANKGVTFDLNAVRHAKPGWKLLRFRGMVGIAFPANENLIANGDFQQGIEGWLEFGASGGLVEDDSSPDGRNMLLKPAHKCKYEVTCASVAEKQQYKLSFQAAAPDDRPANAQLGDLVVRLSWRLDNETGMIGEPFVVTAADLSRGWQTYSTSWTIPAYHDSAHPQVNFEVSGGNVPVAIDNAALAHVQNGCADVRVFVDGLLRFQWREFNIHSGALPINVPLKNNERFLTLLVTDANNGVDGDHVVFGDPRIEMTPLPGEYISEPNHTGSN